MVSAILFLCTLVVAVVNCTTKLNLDNVALSNRTESTAPTITTLATTTTNLTTISNITKAELLQSNTEQTTSATTGIASSSATPKQITNSTVDDAGTPDGALGICLTYKTLETTNAGTTGTARIRIRTDTGCTIFFDLSDIKSPGEEKRVCDFTCHDVILKIQIQQVSEDSWGVEHIEIEDVEPWSPRSWRWRHRSYYALDGKIKSFWVDGKENGDNHDDLLQCTKGKWCDLHKIEHNCTDCSEKFFEDGSCDSFNKDYNPFDYWCPSNIYGCLSWIPKVCNHCEREIVEYCLAKDTNDCDPNPCKNGETCIDRFDDYTCYCDNEKYCVLTPDPDDDGDGIQDSPDSFDPECSLEELNELPLCCDGYLSIGTLDWNFEPSGYYETNWPSQFFAQVIRNNINADRTCCFRLSSADESKSIVVQPDTLELYEFEEEKPVHNIVRCTCGSIFC